MLESIIDDDSPEEWFHWVCLKLYVKMILFLCLLGGLFLINLFAAYVFPKRWKSYRAFWWSFFLLCRLISYTSAFLLYVRIVLVLCAYTTFNYTNIPIVFVICLMLAFFSTFVLCAMCKYFSLVWKFSYIFSDDPNPIKSLHRKFLSSFYQHKSWIIIFLILCSLITCLFLTTFGICIPKEPQTPYISSTISRIYARAQGTDPFCGHGICYTYLLVPHDMGSQMQVVFHSSDEPIEVYVLYGTEEHMLDRRTTGRFEKLDNSEIDRFISSIVINELEPDSTYYVKAVLISDHAEHLFSSSKILKFRTAPKNGNDLRFIVASDIGRYQTTIDIAVQFAVEEPHFLAIGGDLAYENGFRTCYCRYDWLFDSFDTILVTPTGYTIPILASIGNHDSAGTLMDPLSVAFFLDYFPYADSIDASDDYLFTSIAERKIRSLYHSHVFGGEVGGVGDGGDAEGLLFLVLDSANCLPRDGEQGRWLEQTLMDSQHFQYRVALYHVPLYPGRRSFTVKSSRDGREHWLPLFDRYHLTMAFENHDHVYKRTFPLKNDEINQDGTIYIGDGAWGVDPNVVSDDRWYIQASASNTNYFLAVRSDKEGLHAAAFDKFHHHIDSVSV